MPSSAEIASLADAMEQYLTRHLLPFWQDHAPDREQGGFLCHFDRNGRPTVFDVAARIGGGTNVHLALGHPYGNALYRTAMSSGRRVALEIRNASEQGRLAEIVT